MVEDELKALSIAQLKNCLRHKGLSTSGNKAELIRRILESPPMQRDVRQSIFSKWFMKPIKKNTSMVIGSRNESSIRDALGQFLQENSISWRLIAIIETGLLRRRDRTDLAGSPDGVLLLRRIELPIERDIIAVIEMKTRAKQTTEIEAWRRIEGYGPGHRVVDVEFGSCLFKKLVWTADYRAQVLQHAVVVNVDYCLFAVASKVEIMYVAVVHIPAHIRELHLRVTSVLCQKHLMWYREPPAGGIEFTDDFDYGHAVDKHTVKLWQDTATALRVDNEERARDPNMTVRVPAHDLVPEIVSLWNKHKGAS